MSFKTKLSDGFWMAIAMLFAQTKMETNTSSIHRRYFRENVLTVPFPYWYLSRARIRFTLVHGGDHDEIIISNFLWNTKKKGKRKQKSSDLDHFNTKVQLNRPNSTLHSNHLFFRMRFVISIKQCCSLDDTIRCSLTLLFYWSQRLCFSYRFDVSQFRSNIFLLFYIKWC